MQTISSYMGTFLQFANVCIILFGFYKFLGKPHSSLEERIKKLESEVSYMKTSLKQGGKKFADHDKALEILTKNVLALVEFEMNYCLKEDYPASKGLERSKEELNEYLSSKKGTEL